MKVKFKKDIEAIEYDGTKKNINYILTQFDSNNFEHLSDITILDVFCGSDGWIEVNKGDIILRIFDELRVMSKEAFDKNFEEIE